MYVRPICWATTSYDAVWRIVVATPALFMALNDLITGIILPHQGAPSLDRSLRRLEIWYHLMD